MTTNIQSMFSGYPPCQKCGKGVLVPISHSWDTNEGFFGQKATCQEMFHHWKCTNNECGHKVR